MSATHRPMSFALATMASLVTVGVATPAFASPTETVTKIVAYDDLDLSSKRGVERLETRVEMAARSVCQVRLARDLRSVQAAKACLDAAMSRADRDVALAVARQGGEQFAGRAALAVTR